MVYDNFCEFFKILRKSKTNYFFACLMINRMQEIRMAAMEKLLKMSGPLKTDIELIRSQLNLPNTRSAESLRDACGFYYEKDENSTREMLKRGQREVYMETFKKWKQDGPLLDHDKLRGKLRRSTLIRYGLIAF